MARRNSYKLLDLPIDSDRSLSRLEPYFLQYDQEQWRKGSGGGLLQIEIDGIEYSLTIGEDPRFGILLEYSIKRGAGKPGWESWYSVGKMQLMNDFEETPTEMVMPVGAYIAPADAWKAVQEFDANPEFLPASVQWLASASISWPEM